MYPVTRTHRHTHEHTHAIHDIQAKANDGESKEDTDTDTQVLAPEVEKQIADSIAAAFASGDITEVGFHIGGGAPPGPETGKPTVPSWPAV